MEKNMELGIKALIKYFVGMFIVGFLVFVPAGTLHYPDGWRFMDVLFGPMFFVGLFLFFKKPELLAKRINAKEKEDEQKFLVFAGALMLIACFVVAGLDFRFGWSEFPGWLTVCSIILFFLAYVMYAEVMRENVWLSRTVEVQEGQKVIDTGLYGIVRHPMYLSVILLFVSIPLVLGSWPAFVIMLFYPALLVMRILNEEKVLEEGLEGYREYKAKVKYRLLPFIW